MKVKEYGAWPSRNILSGGQQNSFDEFNREYKKVRYKSAEEFASRNVKEYNHYPEYMDLTAADDDNQQQFGQGSGALGKTNDARKKRMRTLQQVVCLVAGSTIIVSSYQAMINQQADAMPQPAPPAIVQEVEDNPVPAEPVPEEPAVVQVASVEWIWDDVNKTATARLLDSEGNLIEEVPAEIGITTVDPTCNKEGTKTYTASVERDDETFTDSKSEAIQPLGHSFDDGKETVLDNGQSAMVFECKRCHEHFTIATSSSEKDD